MADPPGLPRRDPQHQRVSRHIAPDHRSGADEGILPDGRAAENGGVRADRRPPADQGGLILVATGNLTARVDHVGEHAARSAEDVVLQGHPLVHRNVVLDLHVVPDPHRRHDHHVLPEGTACADDGAGHHVAEVPDPGPCADDGPGVDVGRLMHEVVGHNPCGPTSLTSVSSSRANRFRTSSRARTIRARTSAAVASPVFTK